MEEDKGMKWIKERKKQIILPIIDGSWASSNGPITRKF
jgi:hypothetical protein